MRGSRALKHNAETEEHINMPTDAEHKVTCEYLSYKKTNQGGIPFILPLCNWPESGENYTVSQRFPGVGGFDFWGNCRDCPQNMWKSGDSDMQQQGEDAGA